MQDEVNTKVVAIMIKGGKISAEVLKKALDKFVQEIEKAQKQMQQPKTYRGKQSIKHSKRRTGFERGQQKGKPPKNSDGAGIKKSKGREDADV